MRVQNGAAWTSRLAIGAVIAYLLTTAQAAYAENMPPIYRNAKASIPARVDDLMKRMTLEEKIEQITTIWARKKDILTAGNFDPAKADAAFSNGIGQIARPSDRRGTTNIAAGPLAGDEGGARTPKSAVDLVNAVQDWAVHHTRLGIPVLFHEEALHGFMVPGGTMFPQAIAMSSSFDPDLVRKVDTVIAGEASSRGISLVLSPVVDVARDPRWGRIEETFGEDPYLDGEMGVAAVEGLQGPGYAIGQGHVLATLKHFTGHGQPESGENVGPAPYGERTLRENFFPPFDRVIHSAQVGALMPSYNEIDGIPSSANKWLLGKVLRDEWGFKGALVSDYYAIDDLVGIHHIAANKSDAARIALQAGIDSDLPDGESYASLPALVKSGKVGVDEIDNAARYMLTLKFRAGLFEHPFADFAASEALIGNARARALALEAAEKAVVLLKNDGTLPLTVGAQKTIAVIGPNAAIARLGGYSSTPLHTVSPLQGIIAKVGDKARVVYAQGVYITQSEDREADNVLLADPSRNRKLIADAVAVAKGADVIILAIGDTEQTSREGYAKTHLGDRTSLDLVGEQNELAAAMFALGKPVIVLAINGRPPSWPMVADKANAILETWYPGQEGGTAIANTIFGDNNPGGKLPVTVARTVGQLPVFYNAKPSARRGYLFDTTAPLYPFGYGLSYTQFEMGAPQLSAAAIALNGEITVTTKVQNVGKRSGDEVVQIYVHQQVSTVTRPIRELKAFRRVSLAAGETKIISFKLDNTAFQMWNADIKRVVEPGDFDIMVGPNSVDVKAVTLNIHP